MSPACGAVFKTMNGVPILLPEGSVFDEAAIKSYETLFISAQGGRLRQALSRLLPDLSRNLASERNLRRVRDLLLERERPLIVVLGGRERTLGVDAVLDREEFDCVETDVLPGGDLDLICDAHTLPFADGSVDCVIAQAVFEHVLDPGICAAQAMRVLKPGGILYAETPFMQQVHGGALDFTRFTHLGHRRLFRDIEEIDSGIVCGPGMALAWAYSYFLLSFATSPRSRRVLQLVARLTGFWLPWFDAYLAKKPAAFDAASAFYFLGHKQGKGIDDADILGLYVGGQT